MPDLSHQVLGPESPSVDGSGGNEAQSFTLNFGGRNHPDRRVPRSRPAVAPWEADRRSLDLRSADGRHRGGRTPARISPHEVETRRARVSRGRLREGAAGRLIHSLVNSFRGEKKIFGWLRTHGAQDLAVEGVYTSPDLGELRLSSGLYDSQRFAYGEYRVRDGILRLEPQEPTADSQRYGKREDSTPYLVKLLRSGKSWRLEQDGGVQFSREPGNPIKILSKSLAKKPIETSDARPR